MAEKKSLRTWVSPVFNKPVVKPSATQPVSEGELAVDSASFALEWLAGGKVREHKGTRNVFLGTNFTTTLATLQPVTGMTVPIEVGSRYAVTGFIICSASTTAGVRLSLNGPAGTQNTLWEGYTTALTAQLDSYAAAVNTETGTFGTTANFVVPARVQGQVSATAAGNLQLQVRAVTAGVTATVFAGSWLQFDRLNLTSL